MTERISFLDSPIGFLLMSGIRAGYSFGRPSWRIIQIELGLRLRQTFIEKLTAQLAPIPFKSGQRADSLGPIE